MPKVAPGALETEVARELRADVAKVRADVAKIRADVAKIRAHGAITTARDLLERPRQIGEHDVLPTAHRAWDSLLGGGFLRGELVELVGLRGSGRFSLVLLALRAATRAGEAAALVDLGDHFDPQLGIELGIDCERLLWLRPCDLKQALAASETVLQSGFPLVVLDLGALPHRGPRASQSMWLRLQKTAKAYDSVFLLASAFRTSGPAATTVIDLLRLRCRWSGMTGHNPLLDRLSSRLALRKSTQRFTSEHAGVRKQPGTVLDLELRCEHGAVASSEQEAERRRVLPIHDVHSPGAKSLEREEDPDAAASGLEAGDRVAATG